MPCYVKVIGQDNLRVGPKNWSTNVKFGKLVRLLEQNGFRIIKVKGSIRYYGKPGWDRLIRVDYHGSREVPTGTCDAVLKAAGLKKKGGK